MEDDLENIRLHTSATTGNEIQIVVELSARERRLGKILTLRKQQRKQAEKTKLRLEQEGGSRFENRDLGRLKKSYGKIRVA
jgi:hypothetical protein